MDPHIWTIVAKYSDFRGVVKIRSLCRRIRQLVCHLTIPAGVRVDDTTLKLYLTNLRILFVYNNSKITDEGIKHLTNLPTLYAVNNPNITDEGIKYLTNLKVLYAFDNPKITNKGIKNLTNLRRLDIHPNPTITNDYGYLTNLEWFNGKQIVKN
jgi:hypothetical protein